MPTLPWTPWHKVVSLRDDLRSGELSLAVFAPNPRRNRLFHQLLQVLIELAPAGSEERAFMESFSNHVVGRGVGARRLFSE